MRLEAGRKLLHYRLIEKIGEGGMGVVWKAADTTLDREVAIKVLPDAFSEDAERLARFEREAKSLASLNHPEIAAIHSVHQSAGVRFLAMELVPGMDLQQRIAAGPVSVDEALEIAGRIATALQAAHDGGIVHRDLKPANVKLTPAGKIKVLDFGLAKARAGDPVNGPTDPSMSPTMTSAGSMVGAIVGTASYMSPEQARGRAVDQRTDLWALGVILYEMLTGKPAFPGEDVSEVLAGVITSDPDWDALPDDLPPLAELVLRRCLTRDLDERMHSAADVRMLLREASSGDHGGNDAGPGAPRRLSAAPWVLLCLTIVAALLGWWGLSGQRTTTAGEPVRFSIQPPDGEGYVASYAPFFDIMPDGRTIILAASDSQGVARLYAHHLDSLEAQPLAETEGARGPFISADGVIGFVARNELRATRLGEQRSWEICDAGEGFSGASFAPDGSVVFIDDFDTGLKRVAAEGGVVETLTTPNRERGEINHGNPYVLPSGKGVVFTVFTHGDVGGDHGGTRETAVLSFATGETSFLSSDTEGPYRYYSSGHLLMVRAERLVALAFDEHTLRPRGAPFRVLGDEEPAVTRYAASADGTLVFTDSSWMRNQSLVWLDRRGVETPVTEEGGSYVYPSLSPDETRLAVTHDSQIWIVELTGGRRLRLTHQGTSFVPTFSPDGSRVVFGSYQPQEDLYWMPGDGSGEMELLLSADNRQYPLDWHEQGNSLVLQWTGPESGYGIWTLPLDGDRTATPLVDSPHNERWAQLSPDGGWLAYSSDESGRYEIYVVSYPDGRGKRIVSTDGGIEPRWSPRGDELFFKEVGHVDLYRAGTKMMATPVNVRHDTLEFGIPRLLFEGSYPSGMCCGHSYDVTEDGARFMMVKGLQLTERQLNVELHALDRLGAP